MTDPAVGGWSVICQARPLPATGEQIEINYRGVFAWRAAGQATGPASHA